MFEGLAHLVSLQRRLLPGCVINGMDDAEVDRPDMFLNGRTIAQETCEQEVTQVKIPLIAAAATALALTAPLSQAMVVNSAYTSLGGDSWLVDFTLVNDGDVPSFAGFTIDLPDATNLAVVASPSGWDSLAFPAQPDIPAPAAFDGLADNPATVWSAGPSVGGFKASFTYSGSTLPGATAFVLYDASYATVYAGLTTVTAVPEPATFVLAALGLAFVGLRVPRVSARHRSASEEVAA